MGDERTGGKFVNGAMTSTFTLVYNDEMEHQPEKAESSLAVRAAVRELLAIEDC